MIHFILKILDLFDKSQAEIGITNSQMHYQDTDVDINFTVNNRSKIDILVTKVHLGVTASSPAIDPKWDVDYFIGEANHVLNLSLRPGETSSTQTFNVTIDPEKIPPHNKDTFERICLITAYSNEKKLGESACLITISGRTNNANL